MGGAEISKKPDDLVSFFSALVFAFKGYFPSSNSPNGVGYTSFLGGTRSKITLIRALAIKIIDLSASDRALMPDLGISGWDRST